MSSPTRGQLMTGRDALDNGATTVCRKANNIQYLGTLDILTIGLQKGVFDNSRCNSFIATAKLVNNARFPYGVEKITDYHAPDLSFV